MKFQPGDRVLLLHSQEEGEIVDIINDKMVTIDIEGIRFPVYTDQIDFPYFKKFSEKKIIQKKTEKKYIDNIRKEKSIAKYKVDNGVWLSFLPVFDKDVFDDDVIESFKLYLINQTDKPYNFIYNLNFAVKPGFELKNQIFSLSDFYLHDVSLEDMNDAPKFEFEFSLVNPDKRKAEYFETSLKLKAKQLFQKIEEIRLKNEPTFSYNLFTDYPDKVIDDRPDVGNLYSPYKVFNSKKVDETLEPARSVIDLHIEKLTDNWSRLSNFEMLSLQLKTFEKYYRLAVEHRQPNFIVVHGIGSGKLKDEIHETLKTKKEVKTFVNQYHHNFGFGATEIYFEYR